MSRRRPLGQTAVRVDAEGDAVLTSRLFSPAEQARNMLPIYPLIRCTMDPPCGHCWYCQQAAGVQLTLIDGGKP